MYSSIVILYRKYNSGVAFYCITLQHTATHYQTLQHAAKHIYQDAVRVLQPQRVADSLPKF